jgi:predicted ester cyclase
MEALDEIIAPDCPWGKGRGPEPFKGWYSEQYAGCPDLHLTIDEIVAEDDKAVVYCTLQGTMTGEVEGWVKPTGQPITVRAVQLMRFRDGKIVELRHMQDLLDTFQQVGILPPTEEIVQQAIAQQE